MPRCDHCGRDDLTIRAASALLAEAHTVPILRVLGRIERILINEGAIMSELSDALAQTLTAVEAVDANVSRELKDFADRVGGKLSDDERAQFASIAQKLAAINTNIDTADPAPANPPTSEGDSTVPA